MMRVIKRWRPLQVFLRPPLPQVDPAEAVPAALAAWAKWCEQHAGQACELGLSGHWLISCAAAPEQALQQWDHYMGLSATAIEQGWVLRSVQAPPVDLACAAPSALIEGLQKVAREHSVKLRWVGPWWTRQAQPWLGLAKEAEQTMQACEPGLTTYLKAVPNAQGKPVLSQVWTEINDMGRAATQSLTAHGVIEVMAPASADALVSEWIPPDAATWRSTWPDALDFVGPRVRTALWSWALLVGGMAACMAVSERAQQSLAARGEAQAMLHRLERAKHQLTLAQAAPRAASAPSQQALPQALDAVAMRQVAQVAQQLAFPWPSVIERVEQAALQEHAVLTGFSLDTSGLGGKADARLPVRLQAAVHDDVSALRWVAAHGDGAQMLGRDALSTPFDTVQGHYALRAEAVWLTGAAP
jgi:hypothetical protein